MPDESDFIHVRISAPGALLAAVPSVLGFIPERSIILIAFDEPGDVVGATMRYDLRLNDDGAPSPELIATLDHLGAICLRDDIDKVIAVIVDDRYDIDAPQYRRVFSIADRAMRETGGVVTGFVAGTIESGAKWYVAWATDPLRRGARGDIDDPVTSPVAVAHAVAGGRILQRRSDMAQMLSDRPHCDDPECAADGCPPWRPLDGEVGEECDWLLETIEDYGLPLADCEAVDRAQNAIRHKGVRDIMFAVAATAMQSAAEHVWQQLARQLRGEGRAAAATLLAHLNYLRGDGAMAGTCLEVALDADPDYSMAQLLDQALRAGIRPDMMDDIAAQGSAMAWDYGVVLPPVMRRRAG
ncbi:DUF4192 domain-containing protein [Jongsikchunia kroppenstedtii]|uniref:DUF4192 domain-containing protein n=1 Tax=Jongsikchunia kroppenstedtii TaxID=1121721 RepID=UPI00036C980E|nr:DUF4192 domain-containing protein [Jongsikchunia kroppenstedtii]